MKYLTEDKTKQTILEKRREEKRREARPMPVVCFNGSARTAQT